MSRPRNGYGTVLILAVHHRSGAGPPVARLIGSEVNTTGAPAAPPETKLTFSMKTPPA
jgi:hypothetical protein